MVWLHVFHQPPIFHTHLVLNPVFHLQKIPGHGKLAKHGDEPKQTNRKVQIYTVCTDVYDVHRRLFDPLYYCMYVNHEPILNQAFIHDCETLEPRA